MMTEMSAKEWFKSLVQRFGEYTVRGSLQAIADGVVRATESLAKEIRKLHSMQAQNMK